MSVSQLFEVITKDHLLFEGRKLMAESPITEYQAADAVVPQDLETSPAIENGRELIVSALAQILGQGATGKSPRSDDDGIPFEEKAKAAQALETIRKIKPLMEKSRVYNGSRIPIAFLPLDGKEEWLRRALTRKQTAEAEVNYLKASIAECKKAKVQRDIDLPSERLVGLSIKAERLP